MPDRVIFSEMLPDAAKILPSEAANRFVAISPTTYDIAAELGIPVLRSPQFSDLDTVAKAFNDYKAKMREYGHHQTPCR